MIPRSRQYRVCIGTGYTGRKCGGFLGHVEIGEVCWMYRGPVGKDDTLREMVIGFQ